MKKETINPEGLSRRPFYSHVVKAGDTVYIAGQVSRDKDGNVIGIGDFRAQAEKVYQNIGIALKAGGSSLGNVLSATAYVTSIDYIPILIEVHTKYFGAEQQPALASIVVKSLASPDFLVEIQAVAVVD